MSIPAAILEPMEVAGFVPDRYADYRRVISDAIAFFIGRLSPPRLATIADHQAALPVGAPAEVRLVTLIADCPVLHKLAQVVARHPDLDAGLRRRLQRLEMDEPSTPWREISSHLEGALGEGAEAYDVEVDPASLAEASVAVVVPCRWRPSAGASRRDAVLKILKPGVTDRLEEELVILVALADYLDERRDDYGLPAFDHRATFETVGDLLRHEVRPAFEQRHLAAAADFYAGDPSVHVPAVLPFSTTRVTAMERVYGRRVTDAPVRRDLAAVIIRALVCAPVLAPETTAMFHADPHAGNLFATHDGRLAILDWSLVGQLDKPVRIAITAVVLAALRQDTEGVANHVLEIAEAGGRAALAEPAARALAEIRRGRLPGPGWLVDLLDGVVARGVRFPASLMLFRKTIFTLRGVVADIDPDCSLDAVFLAAGMRRFVEEWPQRLQSTPWSRGFGTHVSIADLVNAWCSVPAAMTRGWF